MREEYKKSIENTVYAVTTNAEIPPCTGVEDEYFGKNKTGNKILTRKCEWCDYKNKCHGNLTYAPEAFSKSKFPKMKWYIGNILKPKESNV